ncbi:1-acyl-sn-glycerol-3-phosphate acyltransferase [Ferrigenium kumadai]|uniref:1-acyl-sn-glycerol-3-phosphate acyltransferase n=1 Tax=Ferrigenium kumadai TaxID=1682490 RepID=A0AAN1SYE9_9PROT|nr:lysophospholipid acyltransferase family protein [Ferrigenium kumadai]BBI99022.1 1-acyl-sn-glycerol-3-phosphate acyltransferase [Ferrigenium kumadai]
MNIYPMAVIRGCRVALHLIYGALLALCYPHLDRARQLRMLRKWSKQLLGILNIRIGADCHLQPSGCLMVANHVSWLDIFVLNTIQPAHFIAKAEVRGWPLIGWLCKRSGTIFVERTLRRDAAKVNQSAATLLRQGACVGLFPEGTTTDGSRVGHFHSALVQSAIDAEVMLCPVALRYLDAEGKPATAAAFTGDTSLALSLLRVLCCRQINVSVAFPPALPAANGNRRMLARMAQESIAHSLQTSPPRLQPEPVPSAAIPLLSTQSAYVLLLDPVINQLAR